MGRLLMECIAEIRNSEKEHVMNLTVTPEAGERLEIGFGRIVPGREQWMFREYFPKIGP